MHNTLLYVCIHTDASVWAYNSSNVENASHCWLATIGRNTHQRYHRWSIITAHSMYCLSVTTESVLNVILNGFSFDSFLHGFFSRDVYISPITYIPLIHLCIGISQCIMKFLEFLHHIVDHKIAEEY